MSQTVIYAGTFDPITNGHLDIIQRTAILFERVIVAVARNPSKQPLFSLEQRIALVEQSCASLKNVQAVGFNGLLANFAQQHHAVALVRGVRGSDDIDYEIQLAQLNDQLATGLDTIFFPPSVQWRFLSSTMVREIFRHNGDVSPFVPPPVSQALCQLRKENDTK